MHITILLTLSIPPGEAELPVCVRYDAHLHPEPPGPDSTVMLLKPKVSELASVILANDWSMTSMLQGS